MLGSISEEPDRLTRPFASDAMRRAHEQVGAWMRDSGMAVTRDNIGNVRGRYEGAPGANRTLLIGSHLDSVRDAGKYDGPLGVLVAIEAVHRLHDRAVRPPFAIEVVGFADEEGLRYGTTYLGSRALAGTFDAADLDRTDSGGVTMAEAIRAFGGDPDRIAEDRWSGEVLGYCEVHIEQGPVLEAGGIPVGVVSAIAGQSRHQLTFTGEAAHAGTTPMDHRKDALVAASRFVQAVEDYASSKPGLVATVGQLVVQPGAANVVPGEVTLSLDVRHAVDADRITASELLIDLARRKIAGPRGIALTTRQISENATVQCSPRLTSIFTRAVQDLGHPAIQLASGAGHDTVVMARLTEIAMLFVRCKGGVSHNPAESVAEADVAVAIDVLGKFLELVAAER
jgi:allantoate deiminase